MSKGLYKRKKDNVSKLVFITLIILLLAISAFFSDGSLGGFFFTFLYSSAGVALLFLIISSFFSKKASNIKVKDIEIPNLDKSKSLERVKQTDNKYKSKVSNQEYYNYMLQKSENRIKPMKKNFDWVLTGKELKEKQVKKEENITEVIRKPYRSPFVSTLPEKQTKEEVAPTDENTAAAELNSTLAVEQEKEDSVEQEVLNYPEIEFGEVENSDVQDNLNEEVQENEETEYNNEINEYEDVEYQNNQEYENMEFDSGENEKSEIINNEIIENKIIDFEAEYNKLNISDIEIDGQIEHGPDETNDGTMQNTEHDNEVNEIPDYKFPSANLLKNNPMKDDTFSALENAKDKGNKLVETLASFNVGASITNISIGPTVTRYELQPNTGVKVSRIVGLADDIALNLEATCVRIEAPIPGKAAVGIEVPNNTVKTVYFKDVIESDEFKAHSSKLAFAVGMDIAGNTVVTDISKMPHLLIAGATGAGKSVCINTLIASILFKAKPEEVKLIMVDPKVVELGIYNGIPHLLIPVVTDPKKAAGALNWAVTEMTNRYSLFAAANVRDLKGYNRLVNETGEGTPLPNIVIIIDELADLMMAAPNEVEDSICRLAQMARAAGMHLVIATQRPSVDVITGVIKANIPSRISFAVSSQVDSRTILDMAGAEKLLGRGDMLFYPLGHHKPVRVQGAFISDSEIEGIVKHLKSVALPQYDQDILEKLENNEISKPSNENEDDELLSQAIDMVLDNGQASASFIQRKFKVGYARAARIVDQMESYGIIGPQDGSKPRAILITKQEWEELKS